MFNRVLVPLDGSSAAENVLPYVRGLVGSLQLPVLLLHVIDPEAKAVRKGQQTVRVPDTDAGRHAEDEYLSQGEAGSVADQATQRYLDAVAANFAGGPVGVETLVKRGPPAKVIVNEASIRPGTMIAMSTHGRTGIGRWLLGSVADRVLEVTDSPLLLVRATSADPTHTVAHFERVILPLDGSALAESALDIATWVATSLNVPLVITGVVRPVTTYYAVGQETDESLMTSMEAQESEEQELQEYLQGKVQQALANGVTDVSSSTPRGSPAAELIDLAQSHPHSIMVMSTHGRSGIGRWAMGSVTDRVVRHTGQPVLVLRSPSG